MPSQLFKWLEPRGHWAEAFIANLVYGFPARGLNVIGVTGTDGKTTTSTLVQSVLKAGGYKCGLMTTVNIDLGNGLTPNPTRMTTIDPFTLCQNLKKMRRMGTNWLVLETTSHALAQHRVFGIPYTMAVLTNVTHEHLDYHGTAENYRLAKRKLFELVVANQQGTHTGVINAEDPNANLFIKAVPHALTYGRDTGDVQAKNVQATPDGNSFVVVHGNEKFPVTVSLPGSFNVMNALAAASVGLALEIPPEKITQGLSNLPNVEGRMNRIDLGQPFTVIVDYAHTPEAFAKIFGELKPLTKGKLIAVFGSAGERDLLKRPEQGKIAGELCDIVVIAEEDDRFEDGEKIMADIAAGAKKAGKVEGKDLILIHNRVKAIENAIELAGAGDTVLLLGKGHEKCILHTGQKFPWDEVEAAKQAIQKATK